MLVGRRPAVTLLRLGLVVVLYLIAIKPLWQPIQVSGVSMEPTYRDGRVKLLSLRAYRNHPPARYDVVAVRKVDTLRLVLKRIVGLPGDRVGVWGSRVYVDGRPLEEPYAEGQGIPSYGPVLLGPDQYFAIGDNRNLTAYAVVARGEIVGKVD